MLIDAEVAAVLGVRYAAPALFCPDCATGVDWTQPARPVVADGGRMHYDDDCQPIPANVAAVCANCDDPINTTGGDFPCCDTRGAHRA